MHIHTYTYKRPPPEIAHECMSAPIRMEAAPRQAIQPKAKAYNKKPVVYKRSPTAVYNKKPAVKSESPAMSQSIGIHLLVHFPYGDFI